MYQFRMKDLTSLHLCISCGSDISAESDHYISLALNLTQQVADTSGNVEPAEDQF